MSISCFTGSGTTGTPPGSNLNRAILGYAQINTSGVPYVRLVRYNTYDSGWQQKQAIIHGYGAVYMSLDGIEVWSEGYTYTWSEGSTYYPPERVCSAKWPLV